MNLLIVDDHPVFREGLAALVGQAMPEASVLQAGDAATAIGLVERHDALDAVILDLMLPDIGGLAVLADIKRARPELPVVVLSSSEDPRDAHRAFAAGALGYVPKSASRQTLLVAIRLVLAGEIYVPPLMLDGFGGVAPPDRDRESGDPGRLTDRQIAVLRLLASGHANKTIAFELAMAEKTVKTHVTAIFRALRVVNRTQAAAVGREKGLI